jgi:hypothetical protein
VQLDCFFFKILGWAEEEGPAGRREGVEERSVGSLFKSENEDFGFGPQNGVYVNIIDAGIIDPTNVVKTALLLLLMLHLLFHL